MNNTVVGTRRWVTTAVARYFTSLEPGALDAPHNGVCVGGVAAGVHGLAGQRVPVHAARGVDGGGRAVAGGQVGGAERGVRAAERRDVGDGERRAGWLASRGCAAPAPWRPRYRLPGCWPRECSCRLTRSCTRLARRVPRPDGDGEYPGAASAPGCEADELHCPSTSAFRGVSGLSRAGRVLRTRAGGDGGMPPPVGLVAWLGDHAVADGAEALDRDLDDVARGEPDRGLAREADPAGRAGAMTSRGAAG